MVTDMKPGMVFVTRDRGSYRAWEVDETGEYYGCISRPLKSGDVIHFAVWKGERLESRKTYTLKDGDVSWVSSGMLTYERMMEHEKTHPIKQRMDEMMLFMGDLLGGKSVRLPSPPPQPQLPETEDNFVFVNRFAGKCPAWLREAN